ncbi:MAG TPA: BlaI/MecI/CopY family transcriptional regulator [Longimicrobiaceae bacterium]|nr:BlaI/MecI/CopY family transcriptional regulator [Longimicrobiaceae bacterium]
MSPSSPTFDLGRRERQIMDVVYRLGRATAAEVLAELPDPPSYSAVRGMLRLLEEKGYLKHEQDGPRYVYLPTAGREEVSRSAMQHLVRTFFDNSTESAVAALLSHTDKPFTEAEYERLSRLLEQAREPGEDEP